MDLIINNKTHSLDIEEGRLLLYMLRNDLHLTGTRYGCLAGLCGSCTVLVDGTPTRSCITTVGKVTGQKITTIEGLAADGKLHPVQQAFIDEQVPQCGWCMSGQVMSAVGLLTRTPNPTDEQIIEGMNGNLCRCGTYTRIKRAVRRAAKTQSGG